MQSLSRLSLSLLVCLIPTSIAFADMGFHPNRRGPYAAKDDKSPATDSPRPQPPRKTSPGLCGSGTSVGLAAIGAAWGLMWIGRRTRRAGCESDRIG